MSERSSFDSAISYYSSSTSIMSERSSIDSTFSYCSSNTSVTSNESWGYGSMRVFLVQTARGLFSSSGGYKSNICLLRHLASRGHSVRQLCYTYRGEIDEYVRAMDEVSGHDLQMHRRQLHLRAENGMAGINVNVVELIMDDGVEIVALEKEAFDEAFGGQENLHKAMDKETAEYLENGKLSSRLSDFVTFLQDEIFSFSATHIISNDGLTMQATSALQMPELEVSRIGIIHTAEQLPFGPFCGGLPGHASSPREIDLLRQLDGIWSVSDAIKHYALEYGQLHTDFFVHHPWTYLEEKRHGMPSHLHNWDKRYVGMINPCAVKGSQILINLASTCPDLEFLVYESWGIDEKIRKQMRSLSNITTRPSCTNMEDAWRDIKVLLVPSVWFEAWGIVVIEAHLRGIPVICSDAGALTEAMRGLDHVIPVNPIDGQRDGNGAYIVPEQDIKPWAKVLTGLMNDKHQYESLSMRVRTSTEKWLSDMDEAALEKWLMGLDMSLNKHCIE